MRTTVEMYEISPILIVDFFKLLKYRLELTVSITKQYMLISKMTNNVYILVKFLHRRK